MNLINFAKSIFKVFTLIMPVTKKILLSCKRLILTLGKETRKKESKSNVIKTNIKKAIMIKMNTRVTAIKRISMKKVNMKSTNTFGLLQRMQIK